MLESEIYTVAMARPDDVSGIEGLFDNGTIDPSHIVAIIAQTEGDGHARSYSALSLRHLLAKRLGVGEREIRETLPLLMIGGTAGLMSPHFTLFVKKPATTPGDAAIHRLAIGVASTRPLRAEEFGTPVQVELVRQAVCAAINDAGADPSDVVCVELKCRQLTGDLIADAASRGARLIDPDPWRNSQLARGASALGAAIALGEIDPQVVDQAAIGGRPDLYTTRGSASSGTDYDGVRVVVLANVAGAPGVYLAGGGVMSHQLDLPGAQAAFVAAGLRLRDGVVIPEDRPQFQTAFVNAGADSLPHILGRRHTMRTDLMSNFAGHVSKALAHAAVAGIAQNPMVLGNAGAEHQGPPGSNLVCVIARHG
jgi:cyanuric acid amidohydrolase